MVYSETGKSIFMSCDKRDVCREILAMLRGELTRRVGWWRSEIDQLDMSW
jgi:hypothetical protein